MFNWNDEHEILRQARELAAGNEIALECVERAGDSMLIDLERGHIYTDIKTELQIRFANEVWDARFSLPSDATIEQKLLYRQCQQPISNMLREAYERVKYSIENPEDGDLMTWTFE